VGIQAAGRDHVVVGPVVIEDRNGGFPEFSRHLSVRSDGRNGQLLVHLFIDLSSALSGKHP
jgi:hypothetical protein